MDLKLPYDNDRNIPLVITGCPCSGTTYITTAMRNACHFKHENGDAKYGTADWMWLFRERNPDRVEHLVLHSRDPIQCIPAMALQHDIQWDWICQVTPIAREKPALTRAAEFYLFWNRALLSICDGWYRIEDPDQTLLFLAQHGLTKNHLDKARSNMNKGPDHKNVGLTEIAESTDSRTYIGMRLLAKHLGYEL